MLQIDLILLSFDHYYFMVKEHLKFDLLKWLKSILISLLSDKHYFTMVRKYWNLTSKNALNLLDFIFW